MPLTPLYTAAGVFLGTALCGYIGLGLLHKLNFGQEVRDDGPKSHLKKSGTPTMGGFFFIVPILLSALIRGIILHKADAYTAVAVLLAVFAGVGFADDYIKVRITKSGLSVKQKILFLGIGSLLFAAWYLYLAPHDPIFLLPFGGKALAVVGLGKIIYLLIIVAYLFYISNSVNLADGVDGLCSSLVIVCALMLAAVIALVAKAEHAIESEALISMCFALAAGAAGFLLFNRHPAKVFMGDIGSLAFGSALAALPLLAGVPWIILFSGILFIIEGLSTLLQVGYFKLTKGKRLFRMAPIHHHFELGGWKENKIVVIFSLVQLGGGLLALLLI